jgi:dihydroorotate dehydrogenase
VAVGTAHFAEPRIGGRIIKQLERYMTRNGISRIGELVGAAEPW